MHLTIQPFLRCICGVHSDCVINQSAQGFILFNVSMFEMFYFIIENLHHKVHNVLHFYFILFYLFFCYFTNYILYVNTVSKWNFICTFVQIEPNELNCYLTYLLVFRLHFELVKIQIPTFTFHITSAQHQTFKTI